MSNKYYFCIQNTLLKIMEHLIDHQDLSYKAYLQIKAMILNGEIKPDEKIPQEKLAKQLGISRMPLHRAFQMLENELLVENKPRRGIFVKIIDLNEIADAFECRLAIEGIAAKRAAGSITQTEIEDLRHLFEPFTSDPKKTDLHQYQEADHLFHNKIIKLSNNSILRRMEILGNILIHTYRLGLIRPPIETLPEHFAIIDALGQHNGTLAEKLIREHFALSRDVILNQINS